MLLAALFAGTSLGLSRYDPSFLAWALILEISRESNTIPCDFNIRDSNPSTTILWDED